MLYFRLSWDCVPYGEWGNAKKMKLRKLFPIWDTIGIPLKMEVSRRAIVLTV